LLRPLALATPLALVPAVVNPPITVVAGLALISGFAIGALLPVANGEFVRALPTAYRARAFGVVSAGLQLLQGAAVLATGALALRVDLPFVVGLWSLGGVLLMIGLIVNWPSARAFEEAGAKAAAMNAASTPSSPDGATPSSASPTSAAPAPRDPAPAAPAPSDPAPAPAPPVPASAPPVPVAMPTADARAVLKEHTPRRGLLAVIGAARRRSGPGEPGTMDS
jgi:hypothetical protein